MKKLSMAVCSLVMFMAFSGCSTQNRFLNDNEIKNITQNPTGTITLSYKTFDTSDDDENRSEIVLNFELYYKQAPNTVTNFISLVNSGFYNGTYIRNFSMAASGEYIDVEGYQYDVDNKDTEDVDESKNKVLKNVDYTIKGEFEKNGWTANTVKHVFGTMSMIYGDGYDTANSRFKICLDTFQSRDGAYAAFGKITEIDGMWFSSIKTIDLEDFDFMIKKITVDTKGVDFGSPLKIK